MQSTESNSEDAADAPDVTAFVDHLYDAYYWSDIRQHFNNPTAGGIVHFFDFSFFLSSSCQGNLNLAITTNQSVPLCEL